VSLDAAPGRGPRSRLVALAVGVPCILLGLGGGIVLSRALGTSPSTAVAPVMPTRAAPPESPSVLVVGSSSARLGADDHAALRAMMREELAAERAVAEARADAGRTPTGEDRAEPPLSNEQLKVYDRARAEVDHGLAGGTWTEDDRAQLRASLAILPTETRIEVLRPLVIAQNSGKLHFEGRGPPF
jgi:hypothetical protein